MASPGLAVWMAPSASLSSLGDGGSIVEIDDGRGSALGSDGFGLSVVTHEGGHVVPVGLQLREDVGSDESRCSGQCHFHVGCLLLCCDGPEPRCDVLLGRRSVMSMLAGAGPVHPNWEVLPLPLGEIAAVRLSAPATRRRDIEAAQKHHPPPRLVLLALSSTLGRLTCRVK